MSPPELRGMVVRAAPSTGSGGAGEREHVAWPLPAGTVRGPGRLPPSSEVLVGVSRSALRAPAPTRRLVRPDTPHCGGQCPVSARLAQDIPKAGRTLFLGASRCIQTQLFIFFLSYFRSFSALVTWSNVDIGLVFVQGKPNTIVLYDNPLKYRILISVIKYMSIHMK